MKIKKYKIVKANHPGPLEKAVNNLIENEGWQPHGDLFTVFYDNLNETVFYQPMVQRGNRLDLVVQQTDEELANLLGVSIGALHNALCDDHGLRGVPFNEWNHKRVEGEITFSIPKEEFDSIVEHYGSI